MTTPPWQKRFAISGWALLPLRLFLGFTLLYAGLLKISDPAFLDPSSPASMQAQLSIAMRSSPLSGLLSPVLERAALFGWAIALGEVAVGVSLLLGVWVRLGALGGALLSLSFLLTVSWGTDPYFFGPDIVFLFAFIPLILAGDGGVWSVGAAIRASVAGRAAAGGAAPEQVPPAQADELERRVLLRTGGVAVGAGVVAVAVGLVGRTLGSGSTAQPTAAGSTPTRSLMSPSASSSRSPAPTSAGPSSSAPTPPATGTRITTASTVKVGTAVAFDAPDGTPAFVVQPKAGTYLAYSRICTHEGCTLDFDGSGFACPCHGATFSEETGDPTGGPARSPLQKFSVVESGGELYVV